MILFAKTDAKTIATVTKIITLFFNLYGQKMSLSKSRIFCSKTTNVNLKNTLLTSLNILISGNLGLYLGFHLSSSKLNHSSFTFVIDKVKSRLLFWENKYLSLPRRVTLIKTTLSSLPLHIMHMFKLPDYTLIYLDKLSRNFLWGTTDHKRKMHPISWKTVCAIFTRGGLNLPKAIIRNFSLLMSLAWRFNFTNKNSL